MDLTRGEASASRDSRDSWEASTATPRDVEGPTPDWWPPAEPVAHNVHAADLRMTRASTAAPRDSPAAIAAASRNAIQEAKNRKAAARARMAERRNAPVRNQGGEGDEGGTRDLWERFGQVAPAPPRTLVVVKRPQPVRISDGSKGVALHPSEAASYCDSYNAGGGELYLRLSDGGPDESSGWIFQVVADTGIDAGSVGLNRSAREDMGFGLGATPTVRPWQPTPDHALATLRLSCAPLTPLAAGEKFRIDEGQLCAFLTRYYTGAVVKVGEHILVNYAATKSRPKMRIILTVVGIEHAGEQSLSFGQIVVNTSVKLEKAADAGKNFVLRGYWFSRLKSCVDFLITCFVTVIALILLIIMAPLLAIGKAIDWAFGDVRDDAGNVVAAAGDAAAAPAPADIAPAQAARDTALNGTAYTGRRPGYVYTTRNGVTGYYADAAAATAAAPAAAPANVAAGGDAAVEAQPGGFFFGMVLGVLGMFLGFTFVLVAIDGARYLWARVVGIGFLAPVFALIRSGLEAFAGSVPVKIFLCVLYAYGSPQLDPRHPGKLDRYAELAKNDKTATQSHLTESTLIFDLGFILAESFVDILLALAYVTAALKVCKYLTPEPPAWMLIG